MTDKGYGYEITPCNAKPAREISPVKAGKPLDFGSSRGLIQGKQTVGNVQSSKKEDRAWHQKDWDLKYHKYS
jgi:hypothetical protein